MRATDTATSADAYHVIGQPDEAEQIQVYVQLRRSNADYGQPSQPAYVTVNP